ncbi:MAG TPA: hypothetical protein VM735_08820 [Candidatus Kapabacteria bacterium]|nr:hypothetical protein [Candidatus Kapabacteria bacterium]
MTVLPVVTRELSVMARRKATYWLRAVTGGISLLLLLWLLLVSRAHISYADMGSSIFMVLSSLCFIFATLAGTQATSDSVSEEKREGTLGLLFLTDLKGFDVIAGKLTATSMGAILALMGAIPMLSLAMLLGGVTFKQFVLMAIVLGNTLFVSLSLGVFVSTLSENERRAMMGTFAGLLILVLGPMALAYALNSRFGFLEQLIAVSPLYGFNSIHAKAPIGALVPRYFWEALALTHCLAWAFLLLSAWILPRYVNVIPKKRFTRIRTFVENFVYGNNEERRRHRAELLDRNAFLWLAARERAKSKYAWLVIAFFGVLYAWISLQFPSMMFDVVVVGAMLFLLHLVFKIWAASEVCSRLIQDRRSGALELLLSTPLSVKQIADGQTMALGRLFFRPIAALLIVEAVLLWNATRWTVDSSTKSDKILLFSAGISTFLLDFWALKWVGLWLSLAGKSIERVLLSTLLRVLTVPCLVFACVVGAFGAVFLAQRREPASSEILWVWWIVSVLFSAFLGLVARRKFLNQFRELASRRFEAQIEVEPAKNASAEKGKPRLPPFYRRHPVTAVILTVFISLFAAAWIRGLYWERKLGAEFGLIRESGFPVTMNETMRYSPSVSGRENGFMVLQGAGPTFFNPARLRMVLTNVTSEDLEDYREFVITNELSLKQMWRLPEFERGSLDLNVLNFWFELNRQQSFKTLVQADLLDQLLGSNRPDITRVKKDVLAMLAHARLLREQPLTYAQQTAADSLQRLASFFSIISEKNVLDEGTLIELQKETERMLRTNYLVKTIAVQRAQMLELASNPSALVPMGAPMPKPFLIFQAFNAGIGSRDKDLVAMNASFKRAMDLAERPIPEQLTAQADDETSPRVSWLGMTMFSAQFSSLFWCNAASLTHIALLHAAVAAKRYELKYGNPPKNLEALIPEFLKAVPNDPFTNEPLRSVAVGEDLVIYSCGLDKKDNTVESPASNNAMDLRIRVN